MTRFWRWSTGLFLAVLLLVMAAPLSTARADVSRPVGWDIHTATQEVFVGRVVLRSLTSAAERPGLARGEDKHEAQEACHRPAALEVSSEHKRHFFCVETPNPFAGIRAEP